MGATEAREASRPAPAAESRAPRHPWARGLVLAAAVAACAPPPATTGDAKAGGDTGGDAGTATGTDGAAGDGAARGGTDAPTTGPSSPGCAARSGDPSLLRLRGTIWTGTTVLPDGEVMTSSKTGKIICVGPDCSGAPDADKATIVCTDGVITPGLINPHDHANYNHLPRWKHTKRYKNRYEWQADTNYKDFKKSQAATFSKAKCETMKWAELRALVGGTTSMQGTSGGACIAGWVRDLDDNGVASGIAGYHIDTQVTKITGATDKTVQFWIKGLSTGTSQAVVVHVGEGVDNASRDEWDGLAKLGLALRGVSLIHATGLMGPQLAEVRQAGVRLIWSPQSNLDLYGATTRVPQALNLGIGVALGPDWTPSGSVNMLDEMRCAKKLSDKRFDGALTPELLVKMATVEAAAAVGASDLLGRLGTGYLADIAVFKGDRAKPFDAVLAARPETVQLVMVGGKVQYGDAALLTGIEPPGCDDLDVCGAKKRLCVKTEGLDKGDQSLADVKAHLESTLAAAKAKDGPTADMAYGYDLFPLYFCGAEADAMIKCDVGGANATEPAPGDADGDMKPDASDVCPKVWDPDQGDLDADGAGDACDTCPIVAGPAAVCPKPGPKDLDGDGIENAADNCPGTANATQADADKDAKGDACDACPKGSNPGDAPCPSLALEVTQLTDPATKFVDGELVSLKGLVVTAVLSKAPSAVWAQVEPGVAGGGIKVTLTSGQSMPKLGQRVAIVGAVYDAFGLRTLTNAKVTVEGSGTEPAPLKLPVTTLAETPSGLPYRSLLVEVQDVVVSSANADEPDDYGEIELDGGLRIDDTFFKWTTDIARPKVGDKFKAVRGVMTMTYGAEKLLPRSAADFIK